MLQRYGHVTPVCIHSRSCPRYQIVRRARSLHPARSIPARPTTLAARSFRALYLRPCILSIAKKYHRPSTVPVRNFFIFFFSTFRPDILSLFFQVRFSTGYCHRACANMCVCKGARRSQRHDDRRCLMPMEQTRKSLVAIKFIYFCLTFRLARVK